jgi:hypothetical protein
MAASSPKPKNYNVSDLKTFILQPALTSNFEVYVSPPPGPANSFINQIMRKSMTEILTVSCSEASLPGSSLTTHELNNDFTGVTQRHAYRRLYDDRSDFTFYVNNTYDQIRFFERWMQFIVGEQIALKGSTAFFRVQYPKNYKTNIYITKFERSAQTKTGFGKEKSVNGPYKGPTMVYEFINAFPISVTSMPVSYDSSQLLKCTVSFTYDRYIMNNVSGLPNTGTGEPSQSPAPGVPNSNSVSYTGGVSQDAFLGDTSLIGDYSGTFNNVSPNQLNRQPAFSVSEINGFVAEERSVGNINSEFTYNPVTERYDPRD